MTREADVDRMRGFVAQVIPETIAKLPKSDALRVVRMFLLGQALEAEAAQHPQEIAADDWLTFGEELFGRRLSQEELDELTGFLESCAGERATGTARQVRPADPAVVRSLRARLPPLSNLPSPHPELIDFSATTYLQPLEELG